MRLNAVIERLQELARTVGDGDINPNVYAGRRRYGKVYGIERIYFDEDGEIVLELE